MDAFVDCILQSCIVQSPFFPASVVILLIAGVFLLCYKKPKQPPYVFEHDNSIPFMKKTKKKQEKKSEKKARPAPPVIVASKAAQAPAKASTTPASVEIVRPAVGIARRTVASSAIEDNGDWFEVTSSGKKKVVKTGASGQAKKKKAESAAKATDAGNKKSDPKSANAGEDSTKKIQAAPPASTRDASGAENNFEDASGAKGGEKEKKKGEDSTSKAATKEKASTPKKATSAEKQVEQRGLDDSGLGASFVEVKHSTPKSKANQLSGRGKQPTVEVDGFVLAEYSPPSSASASPPVSQRSDPVQLDSVVGYAAQMVEEEVEESLTPSRTSGSAKKKQKRQQKLTAKANEGPRATEKAVAAALAAAPAAAAPTSAPASAESAWQDAPSTKKKRRARRDN